MRKLLFQIFTIVFVFIGNLGLISCGDNDDDNKIEQTFFVNGQKAQTAGSMFYERMYLFTNILVDDCGYSFSIDCKDKTKESFTVGTEVAKVYTIDFSDNEGAAWTNPDYVFVSGSAIVKEKNDSGIAVEFKDFTFKTNKPKEHYKAQYVISGTIQYMYQYSH